MSVSEDRTRGKILQGQYMTREDRDELLKRVITDKYSAKQIEDRLFTVAIVMTPVFVAGIMYMLGVYG